MIYIGSDHAGYRLKEKIKKYLDTKKMAYVDLGAASLQKDDDYVDYAVQVAKHVAQNKTYKGIVLCGTGNGVSIAANKIHKVRSAVAWNTLIARKAVEDDHANVLALPARSLSEKEAISIVQSFLKARPSQAQRHIRRTKKVNAL